MSAGKPAYLVTKAERHLLIHFMLTKDIHLQVSGIIDAKVEDVWKVVRVFGAVSNWLHPVEGLTNVKSQLLVSVTALPSA